MGLSNIIKSGSRLGYLEYLPSGYDPDGEVTYPMLVYLHGSYSRGRGTSNDLEKIKLRGIGKLLDNDETFEFGGEKFIVICPQTFRWEFRTELPDFMDYVKQNYKVDISRIYCTGIDMGGRGTWDASYADYNHFAAIIPISATAISRKAKLITAERSVPVWAFHGNKDTATRPSTGKAPILAMRSVNADPDPTFSLIPGGHLTVWDEAYDTGHGINNPNIYEWALGIESDSQILQSAIQDSGEFLFAGYEFTGLENNRPPWVISVDVTGNEIEGEILTITCLWDKQSGGTLGTPTLAIYRQDYLNTTLGSVSRTLLETKSDGVSTEYGTVISTVFTFTITAALIGKFLSFDFIGKITGVENTDSEILSGTISGLIVASLPAVYLDINPEELILIGDYDTGTDTVINKGSAAGTFTLVGTAPTKEAGGELTFDGSGNLTKSIAAGAGADYTIGVKFTWSNLAAADCMMEASTNRRFEVLSTGKIRMRSTSTVSTTASISEDVEYNLVAEHLASGAYYVRVELNNGTLVLEETLAGTGANGIASGTITLMSTIAGGSRSNGKLFEFMLKKSTTTSQQKTDILTRLKSI